MNFSNLNLQVLSGFFIGASSVLLWNFLKNKPAKIVTIRRVGDRAGQPVVARSWDDVIKVHGGKSTRIFYPNGDEIVAAEQTCLHFSLLPSHQVLFVAPNGEDFNTTEILEKLNEQQMQSAAELCNRLVYLVFEKVVPEVPHQNINLENEEDQQRIREYVQKCVSRYLTVNKFVSDSISRGSYA
eukprot:TRINITY_DN1714_c1_g1_i1.p1 TRINITY_DN1714_c1_g1~~TRINITY_DN1714_c1_g1_i1.p1  ORF type:complete len:184 (-),score=61.77 TRINITY_DN1714_c1_g1_i1:205-756(-)